MMHKLRIERWRPPLANQWRGAHWSKAHKLRTEMMSLLWAYARSQGVPPATTRRKVSLAICLAPKQKVPDADSMDKLLLDALVGCGLLLDDGAKGLVGRVEVTFTRSSLADWGTTLTFTDVEDADGGPV